MCNVAQPVCVSRAQQRHPEAAEALQLRRPVQGVRPAAARGGGGQPVRAHSEPAAHHREET